ncbi:tetratricopeptide repeat protein [Aurantiacibacter rhizosphaerae]|uniref:Cytochrome C biosynthesis protein n=1 Tax=Aurantiacibacter rhizosphaerae TaxID=2691582 RepID=A0A844XFS9_9SPHN|nr:cytochrome C biosynthesis protein [Aurantiacibacter rhizosphaerae]MWV29337.1 cytochrome C biosynthesis protein [Aurantiacibacter rhizosphaerae]
MTWIAVIVLALIAFAIAAFGFGLARGLWTSLAAALGFGLAGYALQASPDMPSSPTSASNTAQSQEINVVDARQEFVSQADKSGSNILITADAWARRGRYAEAAQMLAGITRADPKDFEAWLAQGIALAEHADGALTPASVYAFQQASNLKPANLAPGYFLGVSLVRQGRLLEARQVWLETLQNGAEDAEGREGLENRLARLDSLLVALQAGQQPIPAPAAPEQVSVPPQDAQ